MRGRVSLFSFVVSLAACGGNVVVEGSTSGTSGTPGTGGTTGTSGSSGQGGASTCLGPGIGGLPVVPGTLKMCASVGDCTLHDADFCCGSLAIGVAKAQEGAYQAYAAACFEPPPCGCVGPLQAEDGKTGDVQVGCLAGVCTSFVP